MSTFQHTQEYEDRRTQNQQEETKMRDILTMIYHTHGLSPAYNTAENAPQDVSDKRQWVIDQEKKGFDVRLTDNNGRSLIVDEKAFASDPHAFTNRKTFAFEVSSQNNVNAQGWLFKPDAVNSHYALIYPEKDEKTHDITKMEILLLDKQCILDELQKYDLHSQQDVETYLAEDTDYRRDGKTQRKINEFMKVVSSPQLEEEPVNIVVDRAWLRQKSDLVIQVSNVQKELQAYRTMQQQKEVQSVKQPEESVPQVRGILFSRQAQEAVNKVAKSIPKLRNIQIPPFCTLDSMNAELGTKVQLYVSAIAVSGNGVVLRGMPNRELYDKELLIACGKTPKNLDAKTLTFKELSHKQSFTLQGEICDLKGKELIRAEQSKEPKEKDQEMEF